MKKIVVCLVFLLVFTAFSANNDPIDKEIIKTENPIEDIEEEKEEEEENISGSYNGSLIATDQGTGTIYILDPAKKNLKEGVLWSLAPNELKGLNGEQLEHKGGADVKWVMGGTHILAICAPYITLIRIADKTAIFYSKNRGGNPHSVELLPDGNIVSANSDGNSLKLFATGKGNGVEPIEVNFGGAHGCVWDHKRQVLWAVGGSKLWAFTYNFDKDNPMLTPVNTKKYEIEASGHDLYPVPGEDKLYFTSKSLWVFDIEKEELSQLDPMGGVKALTQKEPGGEIIFARGEGKNNVYGIKKWQTPHVRTYGGGTRTFAGAAFYKVRWFVPCPFSYPEWEY